MVDSASTFQGALMAGGMSWDEIKNQLVQRQQLDVDWRGGRLQGLNHYAGDDVFNIAMDAYKLYASTNPVSARAFPSVESLQKDILSSAIRLLGGSAATQGTVTSGGTESIFLALKSARDLAQRERKVASPTVILPITAHPAFDKHAHYLGMQIKRVPVGADFRADVEQMVRQITPETIMLVGSAPCYPYGLFDPIEEMAKVAQKHDLLMHVDACVGGFQAPFARGLGYRIPNFDLSVPGVTSISADLHKYGFTLKGASVVLFHDETLKAASTFEFNNWPRGRYQTDTFSGTRSGGPIAAAWTVMRYLGEEGYRNLTATLMALRDEAKARIKDYPELELIGDPELSLLAFVIKNKNLSTISKQMEKHGWLMNLIQTPPAIQLMFNVTHKERVGEFFDHLANSIKEADSQVAGVMPDVQIDY